jgi:small conductance mechanosensitive channel
MEEETLDLAEQLGLSPETFQLVVSYGTKIVGVIIILFVAMFVSGWVRSFTIRRLTAIKFDATLTKFLGSMTRWAIMIFTLIGCLGIFGVETTSFAAVIGGASLAVGLAFQGSLGNIAAGAMLLLFRPYGVGDVIEVGGKKGKVDAIDLFVTTLDTPDNQRIIVPNGQVFGSTITNLSHHPRRRVDVAIGVGYGDSIDETREVLQAAAEKVENVEEAIIVLVGLGGSSVDWSVRCWTQAENYWQVYEDTTRAVKLACDEAGLDIPYPHQVIIQG